MSTMRRLSGPEASLLILLDEGIVKRVATSPDTGGLVEQHATNSLGAAMRQDARRLVGQEFCRIYHFRFQGYFATGMVAVAYFDILPGFQRHRYTSYKKDAICCLIGKYNLGLRNFIVYSVIFKRDKWRNRGLP